MPFTNYNPYGQSPNLADAFGGTTPLASQFYTGGQMGGFPQAQYMTPMQYGSFRTLPGMANMTPPGNMGIMQAYTVANQDRGLVPNLVDTYAFGINQQKYKEMARRKLEDGTHAAVGTVIDGIIKAAVGGLVTAASGGNIALGASAALSTPSVSGFYMDRIRQTRGIQNISMSKIALGPELDMNMGQGFNFQAARRLDRTIRNESARDTLLKQEDYRKIMNLGMEGGMFDYSSTSAQYGQNLKVLVKNFKSMMDILETVDPGVIMENMKRLQTMGYSPNQMVGVASQERMAARMVGISHSDMVNTYGQQGALIFAQQGLPQSAGSLGSMNLAANFEMMKRLGLINPSEASRMNGTSGFAQAGTSGEALFTSKYMAMFLPGLTKDGNPNEVDPDKLAKFKTGGYTYNELIHNSQKVLGGMDATKLAVYKNTILNPLTDDVVRTKFTADEFQKTMLITSKRLAETYPGFGKDPINTWVTATSQMLHMEQLPVRKLIDSWTNPGAVNARKTNAVNEQNQLLSNEAAQIRNSRVWYNRLTSWGNQTLNNAGEALWGSSTPYDPNSMYYKPEFSGRVGNKELFDKLKSTNSLSEKEQIQKNILGSAIGAMNVAAPNQYGNKVTKGNGLTTEMNNKIIAMAAKYGIDPGVLRGILSTESNFQANPAGYNDGGKAKGIGQMHLGAAEHVDSVYGLGMADAWKSGRILNADVGLEAAAAYTAIIQKQVGNDPSKIFRRYNGGGDPNYVQKASSNMGVPTTVVQPIAPTVELEVPKIFGKLGVDVKTIIANMKGSVKIGDDFHPDALAKMLMEATGMTESMAWEILKDPQAQRYLGNALGVNIKSTDNKMLAHSVGEQDRSLSNKMFNNSYKEFVMEKQRGAQAYIQTLARGGSKSEIRSIQDLLNSGGSSVFDFMGFASISGLGVGSKGRKESLLEIGKSMGIFSDDDTSFSEEELQSKLYEYGSRKGFTKENMDLMLKAGRATSGSSGITELSNAWKSGKKLHNESSSNYYALKTNEKLLQLFNKYGKSYANVDELLQNSEGLAELHKNIEAGGDETDLNLVSSLENYRNSFKGNLVKFASFQGFLQTSVGKSVENYISHSQDGGDNSSAVGDLVYDKINPILTKIDVLLTKADNTIDSRNGKVHGENIRAVETPASTSSNMYKGAVSSVFSRN